MIANWFVFFLNQHAKYLQWKFLLLTFKKQIFKKIYTCSFNFLLQNFENMHKNKENSVITIPPMCPGPKKFVKISKSEFFKIFNVIHSIYIVFL